MKHFYQYPSLYISIFSALWVLLSPVFIFHEVIRGSIFSQRLNTWSNFFHHHYLGMLNLGDTKTKSFTQGLKNVFFLFALFFSKLSETSSRKFLDVFSSFNKWSKSPWHSDPSWVLKAFLHFSSDCKRR